MASLKSKSLGMSRYRVTGASGNTYQVALTGDGWTVIASDGTAFHPESTKRYAMASIESYEEKLTW